MTDKKLKIVRNGIELKKIEHIKLTIFGHVDKNFLKKLLLFCVM